MNAKQRAKEIFGKMFDSCYSVGIVTAFAENIRELVTSGKTTWDELDFTDEEVSYNLHLVKVRSAREDYWKMIDESYSVFTVTGYAENIRQLVASGESTWDELGFTEEEVAKRLHGAKVRSAKEDFCKMLDSCYSVITVTGHAENIRQLVASGETTWDELGFIDDDIAERLQSARDREGES